MNLRFLTPATLAVAVAALSFPASAELVVDARAPSAWQTSSSSHQYRYEEVAEGVIEFQSRPANTIVRQPDTSSRTALPANSSSDWRRWGSRSEPLVAKGGTRTTTIDRSEALGVQNEVVIASAPQAGAASIGLQGKVVQIARDGVSSSDLTSQVRGWADQVPLEMALSQVVPSDWSIQARGVDLKSDISWRGNKPWVEVLSDMTRQGKFNANVVWDRKVVVVFPMGALDGTALSPLPTKPAVAVVAKAPVVVAPPAPVVKTWKIDPNLTLRGNVEVWAKQAGWNTVVWEAADYPIVAPAVLTGEFSSPTGPLAKLIDAYRDSDQPLEVSLSTMDKVVHVTNKNFDAPTVAPLTPQAIVPHVFEK